MTELSTEKQILLVEDDEAFRSVLRRSLELQGYRVLEAQNGRVAQSILGLETCDLVISDIRLPESNGIELMHFIKRTQPIPIILMTGYPEIGIEGELLDLGAAKYITKPFKKEVLLDALRSLLGEQKPEEVIKKETYDYEYCKIDIDDFVSGKEMKYDIYVRLSDYKYIKIAREGSDITPERIKSFKEKNTKYLYLKKEDFSKYIEFNMILAPAVSQAAGINKHKKFQFLKNTNELILEDIYMNGVNEASFDYAKTVVEATVSTITEQEDLFTLLTLLNDHTNFLYAHCLGVSSYSAMIGKALKWTSVSNIYKVSIGGLLHDVGKKEIDRDIIEKPKKDCTIEEIKIIESHPLRGMEILKRVKGIPQDILQIILQHHENCLGQGYPVGLRKHSIHPMARVVSMANEFCNYAIKNPNSPEGCTAHEAIQKILDAQPDQWDHTILIALMEVFSFPVPEDLTKTRYLKKQRENPNEARYKKKRH